MLHWKLPRFEILEALAGAGHSSRVPVADGKCPFRTQRGSDPRHVALNTLEGLAYFEAARSGNLALTRLQA